MGLPPPPCNAALSRLAASAFLAVCSRLEGTVQEGTGKPVKPALVGTGAGRYWGGTVSYHDCTPSVGALSRLTASAVLAVCVAAAWWLGLGLRLKGVVCKVPGLGFGAKGLGFRA